MSQHCVICGELPSDECCARCHHAHDQLNKPLFDAAQVRAARQVTGGTWAQFAERCGVGPAAVDGWLYQRWRPNAEAAKVIADILG